LWRHHDEKLIISPHTSGLSCFSLCIASSQDNYILLAAREDRNHLWEVSVPAEKEFAYFYVVDGVITLPDCTYTENDDFGAKNCLYIAGM
jgi:hypothetical protein